MASEIYTTIGDAGRGEYEEKRSLFIGQAVHAENEEQAMAHVRGVRAQYHDARHHVFAYVLRGGAVKYSDDGEPQGSAGLPVLDCIRKSGVEDACVVVTRYFGGILLGTGGLLRAYTKAAAAAIADAGIVSYDRFVEMAIECSYSDYQRVSFELRRAGALTDGVDYAETVHVRFAVHHSAAESLAARFGEVCAGRRPTVTGERFDHAAK